MYDLPEQVFVRNPPPNELRLVAAALDSVTRPSSFLQTMVKPPIPLNQGMGRRFEHGSKLERTITVRDCFSADEMLGNSRVDYSQRLSGYSGTAFPSLNQY